MTHHSKISVSSTIDSVAILQKATEMAKKFNLSFCNTIDNCSTELILAYTDKGLQLLHSPTNRNKLLSLLAVDFVHGKNGYRHAKNCTIKQPLARAAGIKPGIRPTILDATAGLGSDAFVLASLGCTVTMIERSPLIATILEDGMARASKHERTEEIIKNRMCLHCGDTIKLLRTMQETFQTIYLDPMYPHKSGSALNKQAMRTIRNLVGDDTDAGLLLDIALTKAQERVVVKRPKNAPLLSESTPSHTITMKNSRFDVYLTFKGCLNG